MAIRHSPSPLLAPSFCRPAKPRTVGNALINITHALMLSLSCAGSLVWTHDPDIRRRRRRQLFVPIHICISLSPFTDHMSIPVIPYSRFEGGSFWDHFDPGRLGIPRYQNIFRIAVWFLFLLAYSQAGEPDTEIGSKVLPSLTRILPQYVNRWTNLIPTMATSMSGKLSCISWPLRSRSKVSSPPRMVPPVQLRLCS